MRVTVVWPAAGTIVTIVTIIPWSRKSLHLLGRVGGWRAPGPPPTPDTSMQYAVNTINCSQIGCVDCQTMRQFGINIQINMVSGVEMLASPSEVILTSSGTTH